MTKDKQPTEPSGRPAQQQERAREPDPLAEPRASVGEILGPKR